MKFLLTLLALFVSVGLSAQSLAEVTYVEKVGNGGVRVFSVSIPGSKNRESLKTEADRIVIETILFKGVENYNQGRPLVSNPNDAFAKSIVNQNNKAFQIYCKETSLENVKTSNTVAHFIVEVNHYNLLKVLNMKKSMTEPFQE